MQNNSFEEIISAINSAERILVCSHVSPDADAYGSSVGLTQTLKKLGKEVVCFNQDGTSERYRCIPNMSLVTNKIPEGEWPLVIVCDCGAANRIGDKVFEKILNLPKLLINIDHHISNSFFGGLNYVPSHASSTAEVVFQLIEKAGWTIDADIANSLLAGIYGDTGGFRYSSTSAETFRIAQLLIAAGATPHLIAGDLFSRKPLNAFKLQALVNSEIRVLANGAAAYTVVSPEAYKQSGASADETEGFVENLRDIDGVQVACLIYWHTVMWKISLRSKSSAVNVSKLAEKFGGGGHTQAAAFRWKNNLDELLKLLLPEIETIVIGA